jgi:hypothetical protein
LCAIFVIFFIHFLGKEKCINKVDVSASREIRPFSRKEIWLAAPAVINDRQKFTKELLFLLLISFCNSSFSILLLLCKDNFLIFQNFKEKALAHFTDFNFSYSRLP